MTKRLGTVAIAHDRKTCFGASPFWDSEAAEIVYVDVYKAAILRFNPTACRVERHKYAPADACLVSFAIPVEGAGQDYVVGIDNELQLFTWTDEETTDIYEGHGAETVRESKLRRVPSGEDRAYVAAVQLHNASFRRTGHRQWKVHFDADVHRGFHPYSALCFSSKRPPSAPIPTQPSTSSNGWQCSRAVRRNERIAPTSFPGSCLRGSKTDGEAPEGNRGGRCWRNDACEAISVHIRPTDTRRIPLREPAGRNFNEEDACAESEISPAPSPVPDDDDEDVSESAQQGTKPAAAGVNQSVVLAALDEPEGSFMKTAKVDTCGRLWVGSSGEQNGDQVGCVLGCETANIYGVTWSRELRVKIPGLSQNSGMAWSPDNMTYYMIDAAETCVFAYDYHSKTGSMANPRVIFDTSKYGKGVVPHGMTVDNDGYLYIGVYGLGRVIIIDPETSQLAGYICFPTPYVTGVTWGGDTLDTLYVTSAAKQADLTSHPTSGSLFQVTDLNAKGFRNLKAHIVA